MIAKKPTIYVGGQIVHNDGSTLCPRLRARSKFVKTCDLEIAYFQKVQGCLVGSSEFHAELESVMGELRDKHLRDMEVNFTPSAIALMQALFEAEVVAVCKQLQGIVDRRSNKTIQRSDWCHARRLAKKGFRKRLGRIVEMLGQVFFQTVAKTATRNPS